MFEKILVPLDGSSAAEIVLPYAEELAAKVGAEIIIISVTDKVLHAGDTPILVVPVAKA